VVGATDNNDQPVSWSNWGARKVTVAAPGTNILTTRRGGGYWRVTGTSAAAPMVAGIAGLLKTENPQANTAQIVRAISSSVRQVVSLSEKVTSGGVADAAGALARVHASNNQSPAFVQPRFGSGGTGPGGSFSTTPPATLKIPAQTLDNAPNLDVSLSGQELAKRSSVSKTYRSILAMPSPNKGKHGTVYIASGAFPAGYPRDVLEGAYFHEYGNILSYKYGGGNYYKFGDKGGIGGFFKDTDTGANFQKCISPSSIRW